VSALSTSILELHGRIESEGGTRPRDVHIKRVLKNKVNVSSLRTLRNWWHTLKRIQYESKFKFNQVIIVNNISVGRDNKGQDSISSKGENGHAQCCFLTVSFRRLVLRWGVSNKSQVDRLRFSPIPIPIPIPLYVWWSIIND